MNHELMNIGKFLIAVGAVIIVIGGLLMLSERISWLGRLPGDIVIKKRDYTFYFPIATSIVLSLLLTLIFWLISRK